MEPPAAPPISTAPTPPTSLPAATTTTTTYPDSIDSSPRSRATDVDETAAFPPATSKLRLMCSYGGHIVPRPHDKSLCYVGGDTRIVVVDRNSTLPDLLHRLSKTLLNGRPFTLKYQLPNEDLDSLITVSSEEDLDNMVDEYDRLMATSNPGKPGRIRIFLFPSKPEGATSIGSVLDGSNRSEDWFLNALNGAAELQRGFSDPTSVNCLLGLEENKKEEGLLMEEREKLGKLGNINNNSNPDIHSVPDSPIIETTSSFGSTSSSPSLANLPPIRVHVEDGGNGGGGGRVLEQRVVGIEDQFAQMGIGVQKQVMGDEGGFVILSSPPNTMPPAPAGLVAGIPANAAGMMGGGGEFMGRVFSDDERSDHGVPVGYRKQQQQPTQQQVMGQPVNVMNSQAQHKQMSGGELPSPDSVSSDSSLSNAISRQKPMMYQDPVGQLSSGSNRLPPNMMDPSTRIQMQQVSESGYALPPQYEQHQQQLLQQQTHQQQQQQAQTQPQPQQYIPAGAHFVHHPPPGAVPLSTYYQMYPQQPPHHPHQYPVYYVTAGQTQAYSLPVQQQQQQQPPPNMGEAPTAIPSNRPQTPPNPTLLTTSSAYNQTRTAPPPKPDMAGVYRTVGLGPQMVQVPSSQTQSQPQHQHQQQQQYVGYSQIHHPSQSIAPSSASNAGYGYEFVDPAQAGIYYTQPLGPTYQAVTSSATMVLPDGSSQLSNENIKQQIRSSQPL